MRSETAVDVISVQFTGEGMSVTYMTLPTDVRVGGHAAMQHVMHVSAAHPDYAEDIALLQNRVRKTLANVLEDFTNSEAYEPEHDDQGDDEEPEGMGMG